MDIAGHVRKRMRAVQSSFIFGWLHLQAKAQGWSATQASTSKSRNSLGAYFCSQTEPRRHPVCARIARWSMHMLTKPGLCGVISNQSSTPTAPHPYLGTYLVHTAQHGIDAIDLRCHAADLSKAGDDEGECRKNAAEGEGGLGDDSKLHFATEVARRNDEPGQHQREVVVRVCEERQVSAPHDGLPGALCQTCEAALSGGRLVRLARKKGCIRHYNKKSILNQRAKLQRAG